MVTTRDDRAGHRGIGEVLDEATVTLGADCASLPGGSGVRLR
ncbi:hypothetical protein [Amycolatopsis pittospori]|nr:hypothetical protein [Amycolatopsis pittospori]